MRGQQFIFKGLDLKNKTILDAAVGTGKSTYYWAKRIHEQGENSKIISVDNDLSKVWRKEIENRLGEYKKYVELKEADIFNLSFLRNESVDIINCDNTIVFLNPEPLRLLSALKEFERVLSPDGHLIITSEIPVEKNSNPDNEGQWMRWNLAKAISNLKGEIWSSEPLPDEVKLALELVGFEVYAEKRFPEEKFFEIEGCLNEWKDIMLEDIKELPWNIEFKNALIDEVNRTYNIIMDDGYLINPPSYVLKCKKLVSFSK